MLQECSKNVNQMLEQEKKKENYSQKYIQIKMLVLRHFRAAQMELDTQATEFLSGCLFYGELN